jgi:hypothetical protein
MPDDLFDIFKGLDNLNLPPLKPLKVIDHHKKPEPTNWPVTDKRWKVLETRGKWELYEFSVTKERNWCNIDVVKEHGVSHAFYDPDIDPMWSPPMPSDDEFKWGSFP